ncbi:hypothetical protein HHK36_020640 [Tetracentron sinense]|uniref:BHLH domain-containing protein n=1 Tax=Tetracentron sinense TaxID=13715 RepID=A0A834Z060_TETSI|nr:hypothetical protein HHK36_020640 [Tetracentron sinense]
MDAPSSSRLQQMLQSSVQAVQWTYSLFWKICPQQGILIWGDGYYNGAIKTRKTVQPMEVSTEEASLQRSQQLRELYESLSAGETNQPARRPCAALSPEDLTESEWFYLMCVSFTFPPGVGSSSRSVMEFCNSLIDLRLIAHGTRKFSILLYTCDQSLISRTWHREDPQPFVIPAINRIEQYGALFSSFSEVTRKGVSKATACVAYCDLSRFSLSCSSNANSMPLHQSARIQTVLCIPLMGGVVELGTTERVQEDVGLVQHVKSFFTEHHQHPKPALSEQSTSDPVTSSERPRFPSLPLSAVYLAANPPLNTIANQEDEEEEEEEEEDEEEEEAEAESDSEAETGHNSHPIAAARDPRLHGQPITQGVAAAQPAAEPSELMQLEMSEDIRIGSPDDGSNNLDSDLHMLAVTQTVGPSNQQSRADSYRAESTRRWPLLQGQLSNSLQPPPSGGASQLEELTQEESHYSQTVTTILQKQSGRWPEPSSIGYVGISPHTSFSKWSSRNDPLLLLPLEGTSQLLLKYTLFTVPFLHTKNRDEHSPKSRDGDTGTRFRKGTPQEELSANHVLAERRRREKLNERFIILRSLVPFVTKMDKASILGDTIEYVKQLRGKIQDLESRNKQMEGGDTQKTSNSKEQRSVHGGDRTRVLPVSEKRKLRVVEGSGGAKMKVVESPPIVGNTVQVSIIECDALLELQCPYREGLLLDIMQTLRELRLETTAVQSSSTNGIFVAELRAKVKVNANGKKASIVEVKRAIHQIISQNYQYGS